AFHARPGQGLDNAGIFLAGPANGLVFVRVHQRAVAFVGKHLAEQTLFDAAIDDMDARHSATSSADRVGQLRRTRRVHLVLVALENGLRLKNEVDASSSSKLTNAVRAAR